jgi:hypothetical protein
VGRDAGGYREPAALLHVAHALAVRAGVAIEAPVRYIPVLFRSVENPNRECSSMVELKPSKHGYISNKGKTAGTRMYDPPAVVICADSV